jgi:hypothetical protein
MLLNQLQALSARKYASMENPEQFGLKAPEARLRLYNEQGAQKWFSMGKRDDKFYCHVEGDSEVCELDSQEAVKIDLDINFYRVRLLFKDASSEFKNLTSLEIYSHDIGVTLCAKVNDKWALKKPDLLPGLTQFDEKQFNNFLSSLAEIRIETFYDVLEKPLTDIKLATRLTLTFGEAQKTLYFSGDARVNAYVARQDGKYDLYQVVGEATHTLKLMELNFIAGPIFRVFRDKVTAISVEIRPSIQHPELVDSYAVRYDTQKKEWVSTDEKYRVNSDKMELILREVEWIEPRYFARVETEPMKKHFDPPYIKLTVISGSEGKSLMISRLGPIGQLSFARLATQPIIFLVNKSLAQNLGEAIMR